MGKASEIIIITSPQDKILIEPLLSDLFFRIIHTPQEEALFALKFQNPEDFQNYEEYSTKILKAFATFIILLEISRGTS